MLENIVSLPMMVAELFIAELLFSGRLEKKPMFAFRFVSCIVACVLATLEIIAVYYSVTDKMFVYSADGGEMSSHFKFVLYIVIFVMTTGCMKFCLNASIWNVTFYCSGAYATQHIAKNVSFLLERLFDSDSFFVGFLLEIAACAIVYTLVWLFFIRGKALPREEKDVKRKVLFALVVLFICVGMSRVCVDDFLRGQTAFFAETVYAIVSCLLVLVILLDIDRTDNMRDEIAVMTGILHSEREKYKMSKESVDLINMKYHDLKHIVSELKEGYSEGGIRKIEEAVQIYGSIARTGNDVLDVILTEKNLVCEKMHISLTCVCEGNCLDFMEESDLYSLFGNAIDNAVESVGKIEDEDRRSICVNVCRVGGAASVHIENFFEGELTIEDGLPVTSGDSRFHGFGMKSMRYVAEQYGGYMNVSVHGGRFSLDFLFPDAERRRKK